MAKTSGLIRLLTEEEMQHIHQGAMHVLEHVGLRVDHEELLTILRDYGCSVDLAKKSVRFPNRVVEEGIQRMQAYATNSAELPPTHERRSGEDFGVRTAGFLTMVRGLEDERRVADLQASRDAIRLADALPYISHVGIPVSAQEIPPEVRTVHMAAELVKNTSKPGTVEAWTTRDVELLWEIATVVRGSEEEARRHPMLIGYVGLRSPLCLDHNMAEILIEYSRRQIPYTLYSMPCWASTAPATSAGVLVLGIAEVLGSLVIGLAVEEHAKPLIFLAPAALGMRSMLVDVASPTRLNLSVAATQMISQFYGLPCAVNCGKTAACVTNVQAGYEKALSILYPVLAGATSVGPIGQVENGFVFSFRQLVIDHEIIAFIKHLLQGIRVTEDTLAVQLIEGVGWGGNFLSLPHTVGHFRQELWCSDISEQMSYEAWQLDKERGAEEKALAKARRILATSKPNILSKEQEAEIDRIVAFAWRERVGHEFRASDARDTKT